MSRILIFIIIVLTSCSTIPKGSGISKSSGKISNGKLINGRKFPYRGENFTYFSGLNYVFLNRAWVHSKVLDLTLNANEECKITCPDRKFLIMDCSKKRGGRMRPHRTHQNGTSIDFGTPLLKKGRVFNFHHNYGIFHYIMNFDENGILLRNKNIKIDFETMAKHILELEKSARKNGMYIKRVIFKINLKDNFYKTISGKKVKRKNIYFAKRLSKLINNLHDDHYHVDFGFLKKK